MAATDGEARRVARRAREVLKHNIWSVHWNEALILARLPTAHYDFLQRSLDLLSGSRNPVASLLVRQLRYGTTLSNTCAKGILNTWWEASLLGR